MKLSMYILEAALSDYVIDAKISSGERKLDGIRILLDRCEMRDNYVYALPDKVGAGTGREISVVLINEQDEIRIWGASLEEVCNAVEDVFEHARNLDAKLDMAIRSNNPEQAIIDIIGEEIGPALILDQSFHMLAISSNPKYYNINTYWNIFLKDKSVTPEILKENFEVDLFQLFQKPHKNHVFYNPHPEAYKWGVINTYFDSEARVIGQCMVIFDREVQTADLQLISVFAEKLQAISEKYVAGQGNSLAETILHRLLDGNEIHGDDLLRLNVFSSWTDKTKFVMLDILLYPNVESPPYLSQIMKSVQHKIYEFQKNAICIIRDKHIVCCLTANHLEKSNFSRLRDFLGVTLRHNPNSVGMSTCYSQFLDSALYARQARDALKCGLRNNQSFSWIYDCAMDVIMDSLDQAYTNTFLHPAAHTLKEYDAGNRTEYGKTLWLYMRNNCSYLAVSQKLGIHRNTIIYRIERIQEMFPELNLKDPEEREYLLFSLRTLGITG